MKKSIAFVLVLLFVLALSACASNNEPAKEEDEIPEFMLTDPIVLGADVTVNGITISQEKAYIISDKAQVTITTNGDQFSYKVGYDDRVDVIGNFTSFTIPERLKGTGSFSLYVKVVKGEESTDWILYELSVE